MLGGEAARHQSDCEIGTVRADRGAPGERVVAPGTGQCRGELGFRGERRHLVEPCLDGADERQPRPRKRAVGLGAGAVEPVHRVPPGSGDGNALRRHDFFECGEPDRIGRPVHGQSRRATGALVRATPDRRRRRGRHAPDRAPAPAGRETAAGRRGPRETADPSAGSATPRRGARRAPLGCAPARRRSAPPGDRLLPPHRGRCRCAMRRAASRGSRRPPSPPVTAAELLSSIAGRRSISVSFAPRSPRPGARNETASSRLVLPAPFGPVSTTGPVSSASLAAG